MPLFEEPRYRLHVCLGPNCSGVRAKALLTHLERRVVERGLTFTVEVLGTSCRNRCEFAPSLNLYPGPFFYNGFDTDDLDEIVDSHLTHDLPVERLIFRGDPAQSKPRF